MYISGGGGGGDDEDDDDDDDDNDDDDDVHHAAKCQICSKRFLNKPCVNTNVASNEMKKKLIKPVVVNEVARISIHNIYLY